MKITKRQLRRIIREASAGRAMIGKARERNRTKALELFQRFDDVEYRMSKMNYSHPEFETTNDEYEEIESALDALGYEVVGTLNPFKVSGGKIRDKATGDIVHKRKKK